MSQYYTEDPLPSWIAPIQEAYKIIPNFNTLFLNYVESSGMVQNESLLELIKALFSKYNHATPDEDTMRSILRDVETLYPSLSDVTTEMRTSLVAGCVEFAKSSLAAKITELESISQATYNIPNLGPGV